MSTGAPESKCTVNPGNVPLWLVLEAGAPVLPKILHAVLKVNPRSSVNGLPFRLKESLWQSKMMKDNFYISQLLLGIFEEFSDQKSWNIHELQLLSWEFRSELKQIAAKLLSRLFKLFTYFHRNILYSFHRWFVSTWKFDQCHISLSNFKFSLYSGSTQTNNTLIITLWS